MHKATVLALSLLCLLATACSLPGLAAPTATPFILPTPIFSSPTPVTPTPLLPTPITTPGSGILVTTPGVFVTQQAGSNAVVVPKKQVVTSEQFCADEAPKTLITALQQALQASNGEQFAALINPVDGMQARLYRGGRVVTYDRTHAKFLFESTYSVNWGLAPGSGMMTSGAFHDTIMPDLKDVFTKTYTLSCNQIQVGGTTYKAVWPYSGMNYYSVYYPGTTPNSSMDWHTWLLGMDYVNNKPYLSAIMQFKWEP